MALNIIILARRDATTSWHSVLSFHPSSNTYLKTLKKGYQVYVEANYELKDADPSADPDSPAAQRQIFLRHGKCHCCHHHSNSLINCCLCFRHDQGTFTPPGSRNARRRGECIITSVHIWGRASHVVIKTL